MKWTNSGRLMQWRYKAINPVGDSMPDAEIMTELYYKIKELYEKHGGPLKEALTKLTWNYGPKRADGTIRFVDADAIAKEINGFFMEDAKIEDPAAKGVFREFKKGDPVPAFAWLQDDGTTSSGCWVYCGSYTASNLAARRGTKDPTGIDLFPE